MMGISVNKVALEGKSVCFLYGVPILDLLRLINRVSEAGKKKRTETWTAFTVCQANDVENIRGLVTEVHP